MVPSSGRLSIWTPYRSPYWSRILALVFSVPTCFLVSALSGVPFGVAEIFRGGRRMACSPACRTAHAYADDISAMQASKTVPLFLKERQARN